jgi:glycosyltransferase involved in cell wall biosynthesis
MRVVENKMKVLFLVTEDWFFLGHRLALSREVRDAGHNVIVATAPGERTDEILSEGFEYYPIKMKRTSRSPLSEIRAIIDLIKLFRKVRPDLVHNVAIKPILYGSIAAIVTGTQGIVNAVTGLGYVFVPGGWKKKVLRRCVEIAYKIVFISSRARVMFENPDDRGLFLRRKIVSEDKSVLILGSGVDTEKFSPSLEPEGDPVILFAARMIWDKGAGDLVASARLLRERNVRSKIILAGEPDMGNPNAISVYQLKEWSKEDNIDWIGYQGDMPQVIKDSHVVCLPSYYREGIPVSLLEAASCGRAIVTTDMPGCREIVNDGINGYIVPPRQPEILANALERLVKDPEKRIEMGKKGRAMVEDKYSKEIVIGRTFKVYESLLGSDCMINDGVMNAA